MTNDQKAECKTSGPTNPDHPWRAIVHPASYDMRIMRASLQLREGGRNYHIGMILPEGREPKVWLEILEYCVCPALSKLGIIAGTEFGGRDRLSFPDHQERERLAEAAEVHAQEVFVLRKELEDSIAMLIALRKEIEEANALRQKAEKRANEAEAWSKHKDEIHANQLLAILNGKPTEGQELELQRLRTALMEEKRIAESAVAVSKCYMRDRDEWKRRAEQKMDAMRETDPMKESFRGMLAGFIECITTSPGRVMVTRISPTKYMVQQLPSEPDGVKQSPIPTVRAAAEDHLRGIQEGDPAKRTCVADAIGSALDAYDARRRAGG